jgi:hypothetical protein
MQRTLSFNLTMLIKDIINLFVEKEPILPTYQRSTERPAFEIPLDQIIITPEPSPRNLNSPV